MRLAHLGVLARGVVGGFDRRGLFWCILHLAGMLRLPFDGGSTSLLQGDFEQVGLEREVVPKGARQKGNYRAIEKQRARIVHHSGLHAGLIGVERDDRKACDADHASDRAVVQRLPFEADVDLCLGIDIRLGVARELAGKRLAIRGELCALGTKLEDAQSACDVGKDEDDDDAGEIGESELHGGEHEIGGGAARNRQQAQHHDDEGDGRDALGSGDAPFSAQPGNGFDVRLNLLVGRCVHKSLSFTCALFVEVSISHFECVAAEPSVIPVLRACGGLIRYHGMNCGQNSGAI